MHTARLFAQRCALLGLCALALSLAACGGRTTTPAGPANPLDGATQQQLAYGVTVSIPQGWTVVSATQENNPATPALQKAVAKGERIEMLNMQRVNASGAVVAQAYAFLVNSQRDFMPEQAATNASDQDFQRLGEAIMKNDREAAAKNKTESSMLEWTVTRKNLGGKLAIMQSGLGKRPGGGTMRVMNYDIYLPNATGFMFKAKGHPDEAGVEETLQAIVNSVSFSE